MTNLKSGKIIQLESLRGFASLAVVFDHFFRTFYPFTFVSSQVQHSNYEWIFIDTPLFALVNGAFSVMIFFVLSGFVLSYGYFKKGQDFISAVVKRYFRLTPIVFVSIMMAFFLLKFGLFYNTKAGLMPGLWTNHNINLLQAIWEGTFGVYIRQSNDTSLVNVFWTIYYEFIGSIIVFVVLSIFGKDNRRIYVYPVLLIALMGTNYIGFIAGLILADLYCNKNIIFKAITEIRAVYKIILLSIAIYFASFPPLRTISDISIIHRPLLFLDNYFLNQTIIHLIAALIIITLLLCSKKLIKLFVIKPFVYLGSISYSLYAVHILVLGSVGSYVFFKLQQSGLPYNQAAAITFLVYLAFSLVFSSILTLYVDNPSVLISKKFGDMVKFRNKPLGISSMSDKIGK